jgi:hypothetical protein
MTLKLLNKIINKLLDTINQTIFLFLYTLHSDIQNAFFFYKSPNAK